MRHADLVDAGEVLNGDDILLVDFLVHLLGHLLHLVGVEASAGNRGHPAALAALAQYELHTATLAGSLQCLGSQRLVQRQRLQREVKRRFAPHAVHVAERVREVQHVLCRYVRLRLVAVVGQVRQAHVVALGEIVRTRLHQPQILGEVELVALDIHKAVARHQSVDGDQLPHACRRHNRVRLLL